MRGQRLVPRFPTIRGPTPGAGRAGRFVEDARGGTVLRPRRASSVPLRAVALRTEPENAAQVRKWAGCAATANCAPDPVIDGSTPGTALVRGLLDSGKFLSGKVLAPVPRHWL